MLSRETSENAAAACQPAMQPDGKILVAAAPIDLVSGQSWEVARYNADGSIDTTFGNKGIAPILARGTDTTVSLALQPDGRILATSLAVSPNALNPPGGAIARLNPDGTLDNTFGTGGVVYTSTVGVLAVQSDGHILLLGDTPNTVSEGLDSFLPNGQIDTAFGAGGQALPAPPITVPQFEELKEELKVTLYRSADYDALSGQNASQRGC